MFIGIKNPKDANNCSSMLDEWQSPEHNNTESKLLILR